MGLGKFNFSTMIVLTCVLALGCFLSRAKLLTVLNLSPADLENMLAKHCLDYLLLFFVIGKCMYH